MTVKGLGYLIRGNDACFDKQRRNDVKYFGRHGVVIELCLKYESINHRSQGGRQIHGGLLFKRKIFLTVVFLMGFTASAFTATRGQGRLLFGEKSLDSDDWGPLDSQGEIAFELDVKEEAWPVWVTGGFFSSRDKVTVITSITPFQTREVEGKTTEFHLGVKKDFDPFKFLRLSFSGGPAFVTAKLGDVAAPYETDSGSAAGYWGAADALIFAGPIGLGVSYRFSRADIELLNRDRNAGGHHVVFSLGLGW